MLDIQYSTVSNTKQIERKLMNLIDIKSPADLKGLTLAELTDLTAQARQALMTKVSELLRENGVSLEQIVADAKQILSF